MNLSAKDCDGITLEKIASTLIKSKDFKNKFILITYDGCIDGGNESSAVMHTHSKSQTGIKNFFQSLKENNENQIFYPRCYDGGCIFDVSSERGDFFRIFKIVGLDKKIVSTNVNKYFGNNDDDSNSSSEFESDSD
jgi:hypothetical protein